MPLPDGIVPVSAYVPVEVKDFFKTLADEESRSLSNMIGLILENEYKRRKMTEAPDASQLTNPNTTLALAA